MKDFALSEASIAFDFIRYRQGTIIIVDCIEFLHVTKMFNFILCTEDKKNTKEKEHEQSLLPS